MTQSELKQRYIQYMEEYNRSLPASLSDEERKQKILHALDTVVARDIQWLADQTEHDLQLLYDQAVVAGTDADQQQQLHAIRQSMQ